MKYSKFADKEKIKSDGNAESKTRRCLFIPLMKNEKEETIIVILKNPSKADAEQSDYTVNRVINYICDNKNKDHILNEIGTIVIVNLIPFYEPVSKKLTWERESEIMNLNIKRIDELTSKHNKVIIAWGNHPTSKKSEFNCLSSEILEILKGKKIYQVGLLSKLCNPKHGQVWKNDDKLIEYNNLKTMI